MEPDQKQITLNNDSAIFRINPKIYSIEVVQKAAYILMDKATIILNGDPEKEIVADIKNCSDCVAIGDIVKMFNEELLNYAVYKQQSENNKEIREILLQRVLLSNTREDFSGPKRPENDPEGIFKPWEETQDKLEQKKRDN